MNWPASVASKAVDAKKARKAAWDAEIAELRARKAARDEQVKAPPIDGDLGHLVGVIKSDGFARLYEDLTGKNAGEWSRGVLRALEYGPSMTGQSPIDWLRSKVADMAAKSYWGEPWYRVHLAEQIVRSRSQTSRRRLRIRLATPKWADPLKIAVIYRQRDRITAETGIEHEVDHIIPLTHPRVCGLHCEANLRVIPASENVRKSNTYYI